MCNFYSGKHYEAHQGESLSVSCLANGDPQPRIWWNKVIDTSILEYKIQQRGSNLSLGQRQLVCIARALASRPKILLMDEATASIDEKTDRIVQNVIKHQMEGVTVITIAHRLETIVQYDKVLVLEGGRKLEQGSPEELLRKKGHFYSMFEESGKDQLGRLIYYSENKHLDFEEL